MNTWYCVLILVAISNGEEIDVLFQDDMSTSDNFEKSPSVQFVSDQLCGFNICAKMAVTSPPSYLETKVGQISTIGYSNIVLKFDLAFTGFGLGLMHLTTKNDASSPGIYPFIATYHHDDLIQDTIYHNLTLHLGTNIENNDKMGIYFESDAESYSNAITPYVFIDNILILGSKQSICYPQGQCNDGYMDKTNGTAETWACGEACIGGSYLTTNTCDCACIKNDPCNPTNSPTPYPTIPSINPTHLPTSQPTEPCGGIQHCSRYFDGCNNCQCYASSMTCSRTYCSMLSDAYCISCIDGYFINKNGECEATVNPSIHPTYSPTPMPTDSEFGVKFSMKFQYDISVNNGSMTPAELNKMLLNITDNLLDAETEDVDQDCINGKDYDIDIDEIEKSVIINATIFVCNEEAETVLTVHVNEKLETDLLDITANNPILFVPKQNISIEVGIIHGNDGDVDSTVIITTEYDDNKVNLGDSDKSDDTFGVIVGILGSIIFICIAVIVIVFVYKIKKDKQLYHIDRIQTDSVVASYKIGDPGRIQKKHKYQFTPTEEADNDNETNPFDDIDINNPTEIVYNDGIDDEVFVWLRNTVKLEQYYQSFKQNGYDSLEFVKEITKKSQLIEIGINDEEHVGKLINKINDLKIEMKNGEDDEIIIQNNHNTPN